MVAAAVCGLFILPYSARAQGTTAFSYQGQLASGGDPANGTYDFTFSLFNNDSTNTGKIGGTVTNSEVGVTNGLFTVSIDFGSVFGSNASWLAIGVRTNGETNFTALNPLQQLTPTPYALYAPNAGTAETAGSASVSSVANSVAGTNITGLVSLASLPSSVVTNTETKVTLGGTFSGNGLGLSNLNASALTAGVVPTNVLAGFQPPNYNTISGGLSNSVVGPYTTVGGGVGNTASNTGSFVGGGGYDGFAYSGNTVNAVAATIGGGFGNIIAVGGAYAFIGGGGDNTASGNSSTVGGGSANIAGASAYGYSVVAGGRANVAYDYGTVAGGNGNVASGEFATVGGGGGNQASGELSFIGGGYGNAASGFGSFVGGGGYDGSIFGNNTVRDKATTIGGGLGNDIVVGGAYSFIGGGEFNTASGHFSSVAGGANNTASGNYSFAGGQHANANYAGSFVWADDSSANPFTAATADSFNVRCTGGVTFASDIGGMNQEVNWIPGDASWNFSSDRNLKDRFAEINKEEILDKVAELPIVEWSYKNYSQRHIGTMAQDFHALFPLNTNDKALNEADLNGVALAAVQGLNQKVDKHNQSLEKELQPKNGEINDLKAKAAQTDKRLEELEAIVQSLQEK